MDKITIEEPLRQKLQGFTKELQFIDESGQVLGTFLPNCGRLPGEPALDEEELRSIERTTEWYSTDQVLSHLRQLERK